MTTYFDSSVLLAVYVAEEFSSRARREASGTPAIPFTPLHELEVVNSLRVLHGRRAIDARELRVVLGQLAEDRDAHRLVETRPDVYAMFTEAIRLSAVHAGTLLCRSLDVLHVAAALQLGCSRFVSGDDRQLALASAEGLDAVDVKRERSPRRRRR